MKLTFMQVKTAEDIAQVARLAEGIWREYYVSIISIEQIEYMVDKYQSIPAITDQLHRQGYEYYLFQLDGSLAVGYLAVRPEEEQLFLSKFYIQQEHRGNGYASQAIRFLEQLCEERDLSRIWLTVNRHNKSSIAIYERKGFRIEREQVADIGHGFVMDDYMMVKHVGIER